MSGSGATAGGGSTSNRVGKYTLGETLGEGAFGKVKLGVDASATGRGAEYAIKIMEKTHIEKHGLTLQVRREIAVMKAMRHPNIVNLHEVLNSSKKLYMVMDLVTGGELFDAVAAVGRLSEAAARSYFQQLIDGISYCHSRKVYHRDLKPENLLLSGDRRTLKITDFGLASIKAANAESELLHTVMGSPHYIAPEIITSAKDGYDGSKVDIWACGIILYGMLAGALPFDGDGTRALYRAIVSDPVSFPKHFSYDVIKLLRAMLHKDPAKRAGSDDVRSYPWFKVDYDPAQVPHPAPSQTQVHEDESHGKKKGRRNKFDKHVRTSSGVSAASSSAVSSITSAVHPHNREKSGEAGDREKDKEKRRMRKMRRSIAKQTAGNDSSQSIGGSERSGRSERSVSVTSADRDFAGADVELSLSGGGDGKEVADEGSEPSRNVGSMHRTDSGRDWYERVRKNSFDDHQQMKAPALGEIRAALVDKESLRVQQSEITRHNLEGGGKTSLLGIRNMQRDFPDTLSDIAGSPSSGMSGQRGDDIGSSVRGEVFRGNGQTKRRGSSVGRTPSISKDARAAAAIAAASTAIAANAATIQPGATPDPPDRTGADSQRQRRTGMMKDMRMRVQRKTSTASSTGQSGASHGTRMGPKLRLKSSGGHVSLSRSNSAKRKESKQEPDNAIDVRDVVHALGPRSGTISRGVSPRRGGTPGQAASAANQLSPAAGGIRAGGFSATVAGGSQTRRAPQPWVPIQRVTGIDSLTDMSFSTDEGIPMTPRTRERLDLPPSNFLDRIDSKASDIDPVTSISSSRFKKTLSGVTSMTDIATFKRSKSQTLTNDGNPNNLRLTSFNRDMSGSGHLVAPTPALASSRSPSFDDTSKLKSVADLHSSSSHADAIDVTATMAAQRLYLLSDAVRNGKAEGSLDSRSSSGGKEQLDGKKAGSIHSFSTGPQVMLSPLTPEDNHPGTADSGKGVFGSRSPVLGPELGKMNSRVSSLTRKFSEGGGIFSKPGKRESSSTALSEMLDSASDGSLHKAPSRRRSANSSACSAEGAKSAEEASVIDNVAADYDLPAGFDEDTIAEGDEEDDVEEYPFRDEEDERVYEDNGAGGTWTMGVPQTVLERIFKEDHDNGYPPWYALDFDVFEDCDEQDVVDEALKSSDSAAHSDKAEDSYSSKRQEQLKVFLGIAAGGAPDLFAPVNRLTTLTSADRPMKTQIFTALDNSMAKKLSGDGVL